MGQIRFFKLKTIILAVLLIFSEARASDQSLVNTAISQWYDKDNFPRLGLEVELTNLTPEKVSSLLHQLLGGQVFVEVKEKALPGESGEYWEKKVFKHKNTEIGSFRVELDDNGRTSKTFSLKDSVVEIITAPLESHRQMTVFHRALAALKKLSAQGVESGKAVAVHLNIQIGDGTRSGVKVGEVITFLRNYFNPTHRSAIDQYWNIPNFRKSYIGQYSPGMMQRILDHSYKPSAAEFFNDFLIRQSLEVTQVQGAWDLDLSDAESKLKKLIAEQGVEALLPVVKWNHVRLSSLLIFLFPDHWLSKFLVDSYWVRSLPIIEIREPSNRFDLATTVRFVVGLFQKSQSQGEIQFLDKRGGLLVADLERLQSDYKKFQRKPWVVRTMYYDGVSDPHLDPINQSYLRQYTTRDSTLIFVNGKDLPKEPLVLPGESVVFHNLPELQKIVIGQYNPGLANQYVGQFLEHKYYEALFWNTYAGKAMPRTLSLSDFVGQDISVEELEAKLNRAFPEGWVLKGALESATQEQFIITDKDNLAKELRIYQDSFEEFQELRERALNISAGNNPDVLARMIREHAGFKGWRIKRYMKQSADAIVQSRLDIAQEYRVEAVGGKILGGLSTIPRYQYEIPENESWKNQKEIEGVEQFARKILSSLPRALQATPFALDVAVLSDGSVRLIESNPMSNSGFLIYDKRGVKALNKFLRDFPRLLKEGTLPEPLSKASQLDFIARFLQKHSIDMTGSKFPFLEEKEMRGIEKRNRGPILCRKIF